MIRIPRIAPVVLAEHAACIAALIVFPILLLSPAVFGGKLPLDSDAIFYMIPWEEAKPEGLPAEDPGGPRKVIERYYPEFAFLNAAALAGESVDWNSLQGFGVPHLAQWRTRALSPFSIPFYFFELRTAMILSLVMKLAVAGLSAFVTARVLSLRPASALLIGIAYQLSPAFLLSWHSPMADTVAWFPFLLIMFERFGGGRTRVWPACAMVLALMMLGGDPESVAAALILGVLIVFARTAVSGRDLQAAVTPAIVLGISAIAAMALTFVQLLPFAEWLRQVDSITAPMEAHRLRLSDLVLSALPHWYGKPDVSSIGGPEAHRLLSSGFLFLSAPLFLAVPYWLATRTESTPTRRPFPDTLCLAGVASVTLGITVGIFGAISIGFLTITPAHFFFPLSLFAATLLARTAEEWSRLPPDPCQDALKRFFLMAPAVLIVWLAVVTISGPNEAGVYRSVQFLLLCGSAIAFVALVAFSALKPSASLFAYACTALVVVCSIYAFGRAQPFRAADQIFPNTDAVAAFGDTYDRVGGGDIAEHWPMTANGIAFAAVPEGRGLHRQREFESALLRDPALLERTGLRRLALRDSDLEGTFAPVRDRMRVDRSFSAGAYWVELVDPVPRARLIYATQSVPMFSETPIASHAPPVVEGGPVLLEDPPSQGGWAGVYAAIDDPNVFDVDAAAPAILVIAEAWYPGWRAYVDGSETIVTPVDAVFRGVPVPPGAHRVEMVFDSQSIAIGRGVSLLSTLIVGVAFAGRVITAIRKRRRLR